MKFVTVYAALALAMILSGCQTAQTGSSSFSGKQFNDPAKLSTETTAARKARAEKRAKARAKARAERKEAARKAEAKREKLAKLRAKKRAKRIAERKKARAERVAKQTAQRAKKVKSTKKAAKKTVRRNEVAWLAVDSKEDRQRLRSKRSKQTAKPAKAAKKPTRVAQKSTKKSAKSGRGGYHGLIAKHARANGVPLKLALAVVEVESNYRANARGAAGEIGLMQIMPRTARGIGYKGPMKNLYHPDTNIRYGMKYLGKAYKLGGGSTCGAILKYNAGHGAKRMNPISKRYCQRVARIMRRG
ncbi:MAG: transglycosylase SLT domain-containing protein [Pseudomonadota bacterium]